MPWAPSHHAPRNRPVWLFLPAASYKARPDGTVSEVKHAVVVGRWDELHSAWINDVTKRVMQFVYPSMWHDAPVNGPEPEFPELNS